MVFIISAVFLIKSFELPYWRELEPGPGFFPLWSSIFLMVLSLLYIYRSMVGKEGNKEGTETFFPKGKGLRNLIFTIVCVILFLVLIPYIGFTLTSVIFLFLLLHKGYRTLASLCISISVSLFVFWLFDFVLGAELPVNEWGW